MIRQWPSELSFLRNNSKAIELYPTQPLASCQNCGGVGTMMIFLIQSGPYMVPAGAVKWLDFPEGDGRPSGWYTGELKVGYCPVCHKNYGEN